ncbi:hypothetical protein GCM10022253_16690 [Sphingomonas endophytica]|uniref:Tat pathway signal protein n=1 Tax=Sphingomonas endophytica TaxID=869719 RepID=A0ABR6N6P8_9SPHN|nr:hypothetical protein [Sphingomonas endophytica]MBB5725711.1 hypothetical protein [Sphingomonas endophytica]
MEGTSVPALRRLLVAALCAVGTAASPANAKARAPASPEEIVAGVRSCVVSVGPAGLDQARLAADGWSKASISSKDGKPVESPLIVYGKGRLMMVSTTPARGTSQLCTVMADIGSVSAFPGIQAAMANAYGAPFKDDGKGEQFFAAPDHRYIDLASTGNNDRPSIRAAVVYVSRESK